MEASLIGVKVDRRTAKLSGYAHIEYEESGRWIQCVSMCKIFPVVILNMNVASSLACRDMTYLEYRDVPPSRHANMCLYCQPPAFDAIHCVPMDSFQESAPSM